MTAKDGSNEMWCGDTEGQLLSLLRFVNLPNRKLGGSGNTKVCGFHHYANFLNNQ